MPSLLFGPTRPTDVPAATCEPGAVGECANRSTNPNEEETENEATHTNPDGTLSEWPVPGHTDLNDRDQTRGQGGGGFGDARTGNRTHEGIDITAPEGSEVVAAGPGTVVDIQPNPSTSYGNQVVIDHGTNAEGQHIYSQSAHLETVTVSPGDTVTAGQQIGTVGRTGNTPANADAHLHFEVRVDGSGPTADVADPIPRLPAQNQE